MVGDFFFPGDKTFDAKEIECKAELKTANELTVPLPADNLSLNGLAKTLAANLPRGADWPDDGRRAAAWQADAARRWPRSRASRTGR